MLISVVTLSRSRGIGRGLTYETDVQIEPGHLVRVPLKNQIVEGMVMGTDVKPEGDFDVRKMTEVLSDVPLLTKAHIETMHWMADYYMCSIRQLLQVFLPAPPWNNLLPEETEVFRLTDIDAKARGVKQNLVIDYLKSNDDAMTEELRDETGVSAATLKTMVKKGILESKKIRKSLLRNGTHQEGNLMKADLPALTQQEQKLMQELQDTPSPILLFDRTQLSKANVYAALAADTLKLRKDTIILFPDIFSARLAHRYFSQIFSSRHLFLLHSEVGVSERRRTFRTLREKETPSIIIGTRTALFAPVSQLGLIIVDSEHEWTYKSERAPRYHARTGAMALAEKTGAKLILSSRTPSLESWYATKSDDRSALHLIYSTSPNIPKVHTHIVDLTDVQFGTAYPFSPVLFSFLDERLQKKEQSVLLLNRRGTATALLCLECKQTVAAPQSHLPMTLHTDKQNRPYLLDHYSGLVKDVPAFCPKCQSTRLHAVGAGTQRAEAILKQSFPKARVVRMDADTLDSGDELHAILGAMKAGKIDILIGTQPVLKALAFPNVTLGAMLLADTGLSQPHFRAGERVFQTVSQLIDSMRASEKNDVIIQTFHPQAPEIVLPATGKHDQYLKHELELRTKFHYPPTTQLIAIIVRDDNATRTAKKIFDQAKKLCDASGDCTVTMSPSIADAGRTWRVFLKGKNPRELVRKLDVEESIIDVDPVEYV